MKGSLAEDVTNSVEGGGIEICTDDVTDVTCGVTEKVDFRELEVCPDSGV